MISVLTPPDPSKPAITVELLKSHLSMLTDEVDFDQLLEMYLGSAVDEFTSRTKCAVINQTVIQTFDQFPCEEIYVRLERAPLVSFTSLQYRKSDGTWATVDPSVYSTDPIEAAPILQLRNNQRWPSYGLWDGLNGVKLQYVTGYGEDESSVPFDIKRILCMIIGDSFLNREDSVVTPGIGTVVVTGSSENAMKKYKLNYYEHNSQRRR